MELTNDFPTADLCTDAIFRFIDDTTQYENNQTLETQHIVAEDIRPFYPLINFTGMIADGFADAVPHCMGFGLEFYDFWAALYISMGNNFNTMLISFLFTQMGNAIDYKSAIDRITLNEQNQEYELVMYQYGRLVRLILFEITVIEPRGPLDELSSIDQFKQLFPKIEGFTSTEGTIEEIVKYSPIKNLTQIMNPSDYDLTKGDIISTLVTMLSGMGINYLINNQLENFSSHKSNQ